MSDTTITPEERAEIRAHFERKYTDPCREAEYGRTTGLRLLSALEITEGLLDDSVQETRANFSAVYQACTEIIPDLKSKLAEAEARAEKAEADAENVALREDLGASDKSLKEYEGFFADLCDGLKKRFPKQYENISDSEYGEDAFSANDLFEHVIDPAIDAAKEEAEDKRKKDVAHCRYEFERAEDAEAENARLTKMVDWLADKLSDHCLADGGDCNIPICPTYIACRNATPKVWKEAARRAVAAGEEPCQK